MKTFILGVTGVIASGKTTACGILSRDFGFVVINADEIVHELYKRGNAGCTKIEEFFGPTFIGKEGVNRGKLRKLVAKNHQKLWILNKVIHPIIWNAVSRKIDRLKQEYKKADKELRVCLEAFYLEPQDIGSFCDAIVCIDSPNKTILERLKARVLPDDEALHLLTFQRKILPKNFPVVITNEGTVEELLHALQGFHKTLS